MLMDKPQINKRSFFDVIDEVDCEEQSVTVQHMIEQEKLKKFEDKLRKRKEDQDHLVSQ